jgi:hypothetical protein
MGPLLDGIAGEEEEEVLKGCWISNTIIDGICFTSYPAFCMLYTSVVIRLLRRRIQQSFDKFPTFAHA